MAWVTVAIVGGSALMGARAADKKAQQQKQYNMAQSELTRYSPWTGMKGQLDNSYTPDALSGGISGGIQGLGMAQGAQGLFSKPAEAVPNAGGTMDAGMYGNQQYQQQQQSPWAKPNIFGNNNYQPKV